MNYQTAMSKAQSAGKDEERPFWAFKMDETTYWNLDKLAKEIGKRPLRIWSVYITDNARVHVASLIPSMESENVYYFAEFKGRVSEQIWEKTDDILRDAMSSDSGIAYFDWRSGQKILQDPKRARVIGEFENYDDAREYIQGNPPF